MKRKIRNWTIILCGIILFCSGSMGMIAHAEESNNLILREYQELTGDNVEHGVNDYVGNPYAKGASLWDCEIGISVDASGVTVSMTTSANEIATELGIKNVYLDYKDNLGIWHHINSIPIEGWIKNSNHYGASLTYDDVQPGVYYRATCTHYGYLSDGYHHIDNYTDGVCY